MDKFKDIEKLLNTSQRRGPVLDVQEKQALWAEIQRRQNHGDVEKQKVHGEFFQQWKYWAVGLAAITACIVFAFIFMQNNSKTKQIALSSSFVPRVYTKNITDMLSLGRGGADMNYYIWKFNDANLSHDKPLPHPTINIEYKYSNEQIVRIAEIFNLNIDEFKKKKNNIPNEYIDKINKKIMPRCFDYRYDIFDSQSSLDKMVIDRCVSVVNSDIFNEFDLEQKSESSKMNGIEEAKEYMATITGYDINNLYIQKQWRPEHLFDNENIIEYDIYYTQNLLDSDIPFYAPPWHVGLNNDKLFSLIGSTISITSINDEKINLISAQDAYNRMLLAFRHNLENSPGVQIIEPPSQSLVTAEENKNVQIGVTDIILEYTTATTVDEKNPKKNIVILIPVYRVIGLEKNTNTPIEIYIDPSEDKSLFSDSQIVTY